jgi:hypothetical protein
MFGEWYQKTNKTEDTNKLTLLAFKIIGIQEHVTAVLRSIPEEASADSFQLYERCQPWVVKDGDYFEAQ